MWRAGELAIWFAVRVRLPCGVQETLDLCEHRRHVGGRSHVTVDGKLDELGARDALGEIPPSVDVDPTIAGVVQNERWHADRGKDVPDVDLDVHPIENLRRSRADALPDQPCESGLLLVGRGGHARSRDLLREPGRSLALRPSSIIKRASDSNGPHG